jgi:hypothetical protein
VLWIDRVIFRERFDLSNEPRRIAVPTPPTARATFIDGTARSKQRDVRFFGDELPCAEHFRRRAFIAMQNDQQWSRFACLFSNDDAAGARCARVCVRNMGIRDQANRHSDRASNGRARISH